MKKKILLISLALVFCFASLPVPVIQAEEEAFDTAVISPEDTDSENEIEDEYDKGIACILERELLAVSPEKKTLKAGTSFTVKLVPSDYWEGSEEEWETYLEETVEGVSFRSSKKSVASVNKKTGKVKAKKKGTAVIKTAVDFANGETVTFKTKVYVKNK